MVAIPVPGLGGLEVNEFDNPEANAAFRTFVETIGQAAVFSNTQLRFPDGSPAPIAFVFYAEGERNFAGMPLIVQNPSFDPNSPLNQ